MQGKLYPKLIQDVQLVINELGVVTVLWEEQWLSTLQDLHTGSQGSFACAFYAFVEILLVRVVYGFITCSVLFCIIHFVWS